MVFDKVNPVVVLYHSIFAEFFLSFNPHSIFCQDPLDIAIVFLDILGNVIQALLIDFPTTMGIDLATWHDIGFIKLLKEQGRSWIWSITRSCHTKWLVIVNP